MSYFLHKLLLDTNCKNGTFLPNLPTPEIIGLERKRKQFWKWHGTMNKMGGWPNWYLNVCTLRIPLTVLMAHLDSHSFIYLSYKAAWEYSTNFHCKLCFFSSMFNCAMFPQWAVLIFQSEGRQVFSSPSECISARFSFFKWWLSSFQACQAAYFITWSGTQ